MLRSILLTTIINDCYCCPTCRRRRPVGQLTNLGGSMRSEKLFATGYLSDLAENVITENKSDVIKLETPEMERIATIYGYLSHKYDLYELLFDKPNQVLEVDGSQVNTRDLAMFTIMTHSKARGWYWKSTGRATVDTIACAGVPLAFAGARRVWNKTYASWRCAEDAIRCDIFLPHGLASYVIGEEGKAIKANMGGLLAYMASDIEFTPEILHSFREEVPNYNSAFKPKQVNGKTPEIKLYNKLSHNMRFMLLQGWCWSSVSRCADMITNPRDWDIMALDLNKSFAGLTPIDSLLPVGLNKFLTGGGLTYVADEKTVDDLKL